MKINKNLLLLSAPVFVYYIANYFVAIFLKNKIGFTNYGQIGVVLSYSAFFQTFIMFGMNNGVDLIILNNQDWNNYLRKVITLTLGISSIVLLVLLIINKLNLLIILAIIHSIFFLLVGIYKSKFSANCNFILNFKLQFLNLITSVLLTFLCYFFFKNFIFRIIFLIIADLTVLFVFVRKDIFKNIINFNFNLKDFLTNKENKLYIYIVSHSLFTFFYSNYDRIFIAKKTNFAISGEYWYYIQLTMPILVLGEVLVRFKIKDLYNSSIDKLINQNFKYTIISTLLFLFIFFFLLFFSNSFVINIVCGQLLNAIYLPLNALIFGKKKTNYIFFITIFVSLCQFSLYFILNPSSLLIFSKIFFLLSFIRTIIYWLLSLKLIFNDKYKNLSII